MEDGSSKHGSGDGAETRGIRVHTRRVYEMDDSRDAVSVCGKHSQRDKLFNYR